MLRMHQQPGWEHWESHVNDRLGLMGTAGSGNQWYEKGDGVDHSDSEYAFQVESKYTEQGSFSLKYKLTGKYAEQAALAGKKFAQCIRIWPRGTVKPQDYAVIPFEVFVDLVERAKAGEERAAGAQ
jgi:hypothetical protein